MSKDTVFQRLSAWVRVPNDKVGWNWYVGGYDGEGLLHIAEPSFHSRQTTVVLRSTVSRTGTKQRLSSSFGPKVLVALTVSIQSSPSCPTKIVQQYVRIRISHVLRRLL